MRDATDRHVPGFATLAVHAGARPDAGAGAGATPVRRTPPWMSDDADRAAMLFELEAPGDVRATVADPATTALEERVAALEGGTAALAVASGQAARQVVFHTLMEHGAEFIAATGLSGRSVSHFGRAFERFGWQVRWADPADPASFGALVTDRTRAIFVEGLSESGTGVADIAAVAAMAKRARVPLIVDNTSASPYLLRPIERGADIVVHSAAEFLCGHGDASGGLIVDGGSFDWMADGRFPSLSRPRPEYGGMVLGEVFGNFAFATAARALALRDLGPSLSRLDASMILTGIETLPLRMRRHCDNAWQVATFLSGHPAVSRVSYPGLPGDPHHALARRYLPEGSGAALTFALGGGHDACRALVSRVELFTHRAGMGGTRSLIAHQASATLRGRDDGSVAMGAAPDTVRLSVGVEDAEDLIADLDQALAGASG